MIKDLADKTLKNNISWTGVHIAKLDKRYPSRSWQTSLATVVTNITKPVTKINFINIWSKGHWFFHLLLYLKNIWHLLLVIRFTWPAKLLALPLAMPLASWPCCWPCHSIIVALMWAMAPLNSRSGSTSTSLPMYIWNTIYSLYSE